MKLFKQYLKESLIVENSELADLKKHLHDQQMKFAAAQKRKDKRAMDFWNHAIKNTEEEIKYYENENFSSNSYDDDDLIKKADYHANERSKYPNGSDQQKFHQDQHDKLWGMIK